ncbi:MAG: CRTAC1 family protein, partial [Bacteroidota bacterium]
MRNTWHQFLLYLCAAALPAVAWAQTFTEVRQDAGISGFCTNQNAHGAGTAFFDYDNDGFEDLYVVSGNGMDQLYHNEGDGTFRRVTIEAGIDTTEALNTFGVVTGDVDNDGFRDIFVTTGGVSNNLLFMNNGDGTFSERSASANITQVANSTGAAMGDINLDGWLDIYVTNYIEFDAFITDSNGIGIGFAHDCHDDFFYLNNGNGTFSEIGGALSIADSGCGFQVAFTDYDMDRDQDIYVINDFGAWVKPNGLYRNNYPAFDFTDVSAASGMDVAIYGMGIAIGDYDEDLDLDYYVANLGRNVLLQNQGNGVTVDVTDSAGVEDTFVNDPVLTVGWGTGFLDYDNDAYLDLYVVNGFIFTPPFLFNDQKNPNKLYRNNQADGTFTDVSVQEGVSDSTISRGYAHADYDRDGDLDLVIGPTLCSVPASPPTQIRFYRNDLQNGKHWLQVELQGVTGNRDGYGALVYAFAGGRKFLREINGGSSHCSQNTSMAHFGLDSISQVDTLIVSWLGGARDTVYGVAADQRIRVVEGGAWYTTRTHIAPVCSGDSLFVGGAYQHTAGVFRDTLTASGAPDTILITRIDLLPVPDTDSVTVALCAGDSVFAAGAFQTQPGFYVDANTAANGCDSVRVTEVQVF